jgi:Co/Zn/Cd efflux system component
MVADAVEDMESIVEATEEIDRGKRKAIVFAFLSAVFFFIPVVGQLVSGLR